MQSIFFTNLSSNIWMSKLVSVFGETHLWVSHCSIIDR